MDRKYTSPPVVEMAGQDNGRDITQLYISRLVPNSDKILTTRGGGDLTIYDELLSDYQVQSTFQQRTQAIVGKEWTVTPASESSEDKSAADFVKEVIQGLEFDEVTEKALYAIFYGYGVSELMWATEGGRWVIEDIKVRDRKRFRFGLNGDLYLLTRDNPMGELIEDAQTKFWVISTGATHSDAPYGLGLAHFLYWPVFFKRNGMKFWLKFLEKYGTPTVVAKASNAALQDDRQRSLILEGLRSIQQDSAVLIPDNIEVDLLQAAASGATTHEDFNQVMDRAISKIVLSQTMTTDAEGGNYKGEVHKSVKEEVVKADADLVNGSFTKKVVAKLVEFNFPTAATPIVSRDIEPEEDLRDRAERDGKIYALGFEPTQEYIDETYGPGWEKRQISPPQLGIMAPGDEEDGGMASDFAELTGMIGQAKLGNRSDQEAIAQAARKIAENYQEILGDRLDLLLAQLDESQDLESFTEQLQALAKLAPPPKLVEDVRNATFMARMMGLFRAQK